MKSLLVVVEDMSPPLGHIGGPCGVLQRISQSSLPDRVKDELEGTVEDEEDLSNQQASKVYPLEMEKLLPGTAFGLKDLVISAHAAYRMDLRGVTVPMVRLAVAEFAKQWSKYRSTKHPTAERWERAMSYNEPIEFVEPKFKLKIVFTVANKAIKLVTTFIEGEPDPKLPKDGCAIGKLWSDEAEKLPQEEGVIMRALAALIE